MYVITHRVWVNTVVQVWIEEVIICLLPFVKNKNEEYSMVVLVYISLAEKLPPWKTITLSIDDRSNAEEMNLLSHLRSNSIV